RFGSLRPCSRTTEMRALRVSSRPLEARRIVRATRPTLATGRRGLVGRYSTIRSLYATTGPGSSRDGEARVSAIDNGVGTHREGAERLDTGWRGVQVGPGGGQLIQPGEVLQHGNAGGEQGRVG